METPQNRKNYLVSGVIVLIVLFFSGGSVAYALRNAYRDDTSVVAHALDAVCIPKVDKPSSLAGRKLVVLRLDDVQSLMWSDVSIKLMEEAFKFDAPVVAGVIPKDIDKNTKMIHFLKRNRCNIEIALHGWDHSGGTYDEATNVFTTEFGHIDREDAMRRMELGKKALEPLYGKPMTTFIPPYNVISDEGKRAVFDEGFLVNSSEGKDHFDYDATPYDFINSKEVPISNVVDKCDKRFEKGRHCVIMLHPQEYAGADGNVDMSKYPGNYVALLRMLADKNVTFVTFESIMQSKNRANLPY